MIQSFLYSGTSIVVFLNGHIKARYADLKEMLKILSNISNLFLASIFPYRES